VSKVKSVEHVKCPELSRYHNDVIVIVYENGKVEVLCPSKDDCVAEECKWEKG
jgi:hypothetical protein